MGKSLSSGAARMLEQKWTSMGTVFLAIALAGCYRQPPLAQPMGSVLDQRGITSPVTTESGDAFLAAYQVFMHPRCMNCHPKGDIPLQGEDSHLHFQNVQRGPEGKGLFALKCANCHQWKNLPGEYMPPGHPEWHLPPPEMPLVFEGKTPAQLAQQLKDPKQNGGKTLEEIVRHVSEDSLVLTAWNPGDGRTIPPLSREEFARKMREWVDKGAAVPASTNR